MKTKTTPTERDRETTERRLLDTIGQMITESGFEKIGINAVASQSGVSKILIYRYFGSVEGLMAAYIRQHDFWINFPQELPDRSQLPAFLKNMFKEQIEQLRSNPTLKRLYRWELSSDNTIVMTLKEQREKASMQRLTKISELTGYSLEELAPLATILTASITYLVMLEEFCPVYNGIPLNKDAGWKQIIEGINTLIDKLLRM